MRSPVVILAALLLAGAGLPATDSAAAPRINRTAVTFGPADIVPTRGTLHLMLERGSVPYVDIYVNNLFCWRQHAGYERQLVLKVGRTYLVSARYQGRNKTFNAEIKAGKSTPGMFRL